MGTDQTSRIKNQIIKVFLLAAEIVLLAWGPLADWIAFGVSLKWQLKETTVFAIWALGLLFDPDAGAGFDYILINLFRVRTWELPALMVEVSVWSLWYTFRFKRLEPDFHQAHSGWSLLLPWHKLAENYLLAWRWPDKYRPHSGMLNAL